METTLVEAVDKLRVASGAPNRGLRAVLDGNLEQCRGCLFTTSTLVMDARLALVGLFWGLDSGPEGGRLPLILERRQVKLDPVPTVQLALRWGIEKLSLTG